MLRTLLVGILALSAVAACSGKSDPPAAQPGAVAGEVLEVTGKATATRGTEVRALTRGSEISADDVIDTASESRVVILLAHNNARWDLGPNKHGKVGDSLAWSAAKVDRPAAAVVEETSTAGRHAEKTAATTDTTTEKTAATTDTTTEGDKTEPKRPVSPLTTAPGGSPPPTGGALAETPSPPPPPPPPPNDPQAMDGETTVADNSVRDLSKRVPPNPGPKTESQENTVSSPRVPRGDSSASPEHMLRLEINRTIAKQRTALGACLEGTERLVVLVTVMKGIYSFSTTDAAATDKTRACLAKVATTLTSTTKLDTMVRVRTIILK